VWSVRKWKEKYLKVVLCKLVLSATVYNSWRERCNIKHGNKLMIQGAGKMNNYVSSEIWILVFLKP
jgi:hypothetical protein